MDLISFKFSMNIWIIIITSIVSVICFNRSTLTNLLIFWPARMQKATDYYRFVTSGLLHADFMHLFFNMFTLYFFGEAIEDQLGPSMYLLFYIMALVVSHLLTFFKFRNNLIYRSLGASGAVSAVLFAYIYMAPWSMLYLFATIPVPAILFALFFVLYSIRMGKRGRDNVNHDAHILGGVFGFLFMLFFVDSSHGAYFIEQLKNIPFLN